MGERSNIWEELFKESGSTKGASWAIRTVVSMKVESAFLNDNIGFLIWDYLRTEIYDSDER